jgi:hypothetical protein
VIFQFLFIYRALHKDYFISKSKSLLLVVFQKRGWRINLFFLLERTTSYDPQVWKAKSLYRDIRCRQSHGLNFGFTANRLERSRLLPQCSERV